MGMLPEPLEEEARVHHWMVVVHLLLKVELVMLHLTLEVLVVLVVLEVPEVLMVQLLGDHRWV